MKTVICKKTQLFEGPLLLVNRRHPLQKTAAGELSPVDETHPEILVERQMARLLSACIQAAGGEREIIPVSGWRSHADQQRIWNETLAEEGEAFTRQYVAPPGCSEHQTGLAIDLGKAAPSIDFIRPDFPDEGVCGTFRRLAARYGFIERYAQGKEALTGIAHEPWHFRYVGAPHAQLIKENGLCLEEYSAFLRQGPQHLPNGPWVFYVPCAGGETEIELPDGCCQISGDNAEGFIVTAWGNPA